PDYSHRKLKRVNIQQLGGRFCVDNLEERLQGACRYASCYGAAILTAIKPERNLICTVVSDLKCVESGVERDCAVCLRAHCSRLHVTDPVCRRRAADVLKPDSICRRITGHRVREAHPNTDFGVWVGGCGILSEDEYGRPS